MAAMACVVPLETGEQKKVVLPTGSHDELVHALYAHTAVDEQTLPTSSECIEAGLSSRAHDPSREHLNQSAYSICTIELVEIHLPLRNQYDYLEFKLLALGPYEEGLQRGEPVVGPVRRAIINKIFQACFKIVWYVVLLTYCSARFSLKELYNTAVEQLIQKYPHLRDNIKKGIVKTCIKNKFTNNRKKTQNISEEMEAVRTINAPKRPRGPGPEEINKKLCRLSDNPELVVYDETVEGRHWHHEWLTENASTAGDGELRPRLLATAKKRHERLEHMPIQQALLEYPFLAPEHSLQLEFNLLLKNILENLMKGFECLCGMILRHGHQEEVTDFEELASNC
ncbi:hypothetical protein HPB51_016596 [Rhipicephalus microplus]|uniref:Uncharacterized protein n=1 Tax=Rhipicephalus microplus TaxID=6941 RepID=A0A9J6E2P0_RHIMP|nr:hypothetical protein HPB51_016596 [Rhipicephalus microplus]